MKKFTKTKSNLLIRIEKNKKNEEEKELQQQK